MSGVRFCSTSFACVANIYYSRRAKHGVGPLSRLSKQVAGIALSSSIVKETMFASIMRISILLLNLLNYDLKAQCVAFKGGVIE